MSHYRKHVRSAVQNDFPEPNKGESIVRVFDTKNGGNVLEVEFSNGKKMLVFRPSKFKALVYIKKGQYLIIQVNEEEEKCSGKILGSIEHVLLEGQVENLKEKGLWPKEWMEMEKEKEKKPEYNQFAQKEDSEEDEDKDLFVNTNRLVYEEEESSSEE